MSNEWEDGFWDDDPDPVMTKGAIAAAQEAAQEAAAAELVTKLHTHLEAYFPRGTEEKRPKPVTMARRMGDHWVGFIGSIKPGGTDLVWSGFWRQDVATLQNSFHRSRGASIEKSTKVVTTPKQAALWLAWVHRNICKVSGEAIRNALHPDNFLKDASVAFRSAYDCHMIDADFDDVEDIIVQRLPWKKLGPQRHAVTLFREGSKIGLVACRYKNQWAYGGTFESAKVHSMFAMTPDPKFKHKVPDARCPDEDSALKRAERLYAKKLFEWLMEQGQTEGLRRRR